MNKTAHTAKKEYFIFGSVLVVRSILFSNYEQFEEVIFVRNRGWDTLAFVHLPSTTTTTLTLTTYEFHDQTVDTVLFEMDLSS